MGFLLGLGRAPDLSARPARSKKMAERGLFLNPGAMLWGDGQCEHCGEALSLPALCWVVG